MKGPEERESWSRPIEFFLTLIGYCVGLGNILRFPYVCLQNGGGAFLIPYFLCLFLCGMPLFFMEMVIGQHTRQSYIACWDHVSPLVKGIGYSMLLVLLVHCWEYQACITWILYYLQASCRATLPWTTCNNTWNTELCVLSLGSAVNASNSTGDYYTDIYSDNGTDSTLFEPKSAAEEYWENHVLEISSGIDELGGVKWQLAVTHVVGWGLVYLCVVKGVHSIGKVVWVTSILPYVLITIFLIRSATLPGALKGVKYYVIPDMEKLKTGKVWMNGFLQIFYSLGPGWGGIITMASFNDRHHPLHREALLAPIINCLTSFYAGFAVFCCAGFLSQETGLPVDKVLKSGPGLSFITYPEIASHLPVGQVWSVLFFGMLLMVALDSQFIVMQSAVTGIRDVLQLGSKQTQILSILLVVANILLGLLFSTRGGMYIFQIVDWYFVSLALFAVCFCECIAVIWIYKFDRFARDVFQMVGIRIRLVKWLLVPLLGVIIPVLLLVAFVWTCIGLKPPVYGDYIYPDWAGMFGILLALLMVIPTAVYAIIKFATFAGPDFKTEAVKFVKAPSPSKEAVMMEAIECEPLT